MVARTDSCIDTELNDTADVGACGHFNQNAPSQSQWTKISTMVAAFYLDNDLPINIMAAIGLAKVYPPIGVRYLAPDITAKWIAVSAIFVIAGLGLRTSDFQKIIFRQVPFNIFIQFYNFGVVSLIVFGACRLLSLSGLVSQPLIDGLVICSCLPMAVNAGIVLTAASAGDEAAAVFHASIGNILGIFISPLLIVLYLPGAVAEVDLARVFLDLVLRVLVPLIVGQMIQKTAKRMHENFMKHKRKFKKCSELLLVFIV